jgi:predicted DNA-binding protein YlxM (UPF0122 family)
MIEPSERKKTGYSLYFKDHKTIDEISEKFSVKPQTVKGWITSVGLRKIQKIAIAADPITSDDLADILERKLTDKEYSYLESEIVDVVNDRWGRWTIEGKKRHWQDHRQRVFHMLGEIIAKDVVETIEESILPQIEKQLKKSISK